MLTDTPDTSRGPVEPAVTERKTSTEKTTETERSAPAPKGGDGVGDMRADSERV